MANVALVVFADTETHADTGRVANALTAAKEFKDANDEVALVFDGAGTRWIGELSRTSSKSPTAPPNCRHSSRGPRISDEARGR
ncbi:MAG: hypothetical protein H0U02_16195 [Rubrobacter sp.]|jgi:hypothetical protein|nr:hypothetical protein [Rubrobacter sp.]MBA3790651.1 hypothetical protein [Rubrobacter sp.]